MVNKQSLLIGLRRDIWSYFAGDIDEAAVYDRALSEPDIQAVYQAGSAGKCKPPIFVASVSPQYKPVGNVYQVGASVAIQDTNGSPVYGSTVLLKLTRPHGSVAVYRLQTGINGVATLTFVSGATGTYTLTVANVTAAGRTYDPEQNVETSDSVTVP